VFKTLTALCPSFRFPTAESEIVESSAALVTAAANRIYQSGTLAKYYKTPTMFNNHLDILKNVARNAFQSEPAIRLSVPLPTSEFANDAKTTAAKFILESTPTQDSPTALGQPPTPREFEKKRKRSRNSARTPQRGYSAREVELEVMTSFCPRYKEYKASSTSSSSSSSTNIHTTHTTIATITTTTAAQGTSSAAGPQTKRTKQLVVPSEAKRARKAKISLEKPARVVTPDDELLAGIAAATGMSVDGASSAVVAGSSSSSASAGPGSSSRSASAGSGSRSRSRAPSSSPSSHASTGTSIPAAIPPVDRKGKGKMKDLQSSSLVSSRQASASSSSSVGTHVTSNPSFGEDYWTRFKPSKGKHIRIVFSQLS
jgi:hypothetical protein